MNAQEIEAMYQELVKGLREILPKLQWMKLDMPMGGVGYMTTDLSNDTFVWRVTVARVVFDNITKYDGMVGNGALFSRMRPDFAEAVFHAAEKACP